MVLSPSLGDARRQGSHFVSGGGQKVAVVSRYTRACPLVPPTLSSQSTATSLSSRLSDNERETYPSLHRFSSSLIPLRETDSPTLGPRLPHLGELDHLPFCARRTLWPPSSSSRQKRRFPLDPSRPPPCLLHGHYHCRLLLRFSSTSNGNDPTRPTVARYYHSVLLAIYRPLSTTLPPNGVYRCCLPWLPACQRDRC